MASSSPIDAYLEGRPPDQRDALQRLRAQIRQLVPDAVEVISYGMPGFKLGGTVVVWIAGWKSHCSLYPLTDSFLQDHAEALQPFTITKGSIHFTPAAPLPETLVEELVRARLTDLRGDAG
jgi:uncharacterized protein YdhG (YjbR/CyaY superfamily)